MRVRCGVGALRGGRLRWVPVVSPLWQGSDWHCGGLVG